jgi:hypothetical protein
MTRPVSSPAALSLAQELEADLVAFPGVSCYRNKSSCSQ